MSGNFFLAVLLFLALGSAVICQQDYVEGVDIVQVEETTNEEQVVENADIIIEEVPHIVKESEEIEILPVVEEAGQIEEFMPAPSEEKAKR